MLRYVWIGACYTETASTYANGADVIEAFYPWLSAIDGIKTYNPNAILLQYFDLPFTLGQYDYPGMTQTCMSNGWLLKDSSGNYVMYGSLYLWDIGNPNARAWVANMLEQNILAHPSLDGTDSDDYQVTLNYFYNLGLNPPMNPRTGTTWTSQDVCNAVTAFTNTLKQTTNKMVFANGIQNGGYFFDSSQTSYWTQAFSNANLDGIMSEGLFSNPPYTSNPNWVSESYWLNSINYLVWLQNNWMTSGNKYEITIAEDAQTDQAGLPSFLPSGATPQQYMTFCFASELLTVQHNYSCMDAAAYTFNSDGFYQSLFSKNITNSLGTPSGAYSITSGTHLYARQFSSGMVIVNPTGTAYSMTIGTGYKNAITGSTAASSITVQGNTAVILLKSA